MDGTRNTDLRGKRYIAYARCASKQGSTQSLRRQIRVIRQLGNDLKMRCVDEVRCPGGDGHTPLLRWNVCALLVRKFNEDDYDVLVMEDPARLTRADGAEKLEALFAHCGVQIIYVATWLADGMTPHRTARPKRKLKRGSSRAGSKPGKTRTARPR